MAKLVQGENQEGSPPGTTGHRGLAPAQGPPERRDADQSCLRAFRNTGRFNGGEWKNFRRARGAPQLSGARFWQAPASEGTPKKQKNDAGRGGGEPRGVSRDGLAALTNGMTTSVLEIATACGGLLLGASPASSPGARAPTRV